MKAKILFGLMLLTAFWTTSCDDTKKQAKINAGGFALEANDSIPASTARPEPKATNITFQRILAGEKELLAVAPEKIQSYLQSSASSGESLVAAFQATHDQEYLRLAARNHSDEPRVQLAILLHDALPGERARWINRLKQSAPSNSLANYIAAREAFKNLQPALALQELAVADRKPQFREHASENMQALEKLYLADGRPVAEAKLEGMVSVLLPHLKLLRDLAKDMRSLQREYRNAGDERAADVMAAKICRLGQRLSSGQGAFSILSQMIGLRIELDVLKNYPPEATPDFLTTSVDERQAQLRSQEKAVRAASKFFEQWLPTAAEGDVVTYVDRVMAHGEPASLAWLQSQGGQR